MTSNKPKNGCRQKLADCVALRPFLNSQKPRVLIGSVYILYRVIQRQQEPRRRLNGDAACVILSMYSFVNSGQIGFGSGFPHFERDATKWPSVVLHHWDGFLALSFHIKRLIIF